ncbi:hypothetical protein ACFOLF_21290 [Paenibacillus sepulcri]|uniref:RHS repeat protein n=1 Tax=Paenibacillus sepulcri TaxID=359917 RepID=A0ABS7BWL3_9BACL|nr:hypothetical protein [Paenibacillus sepulcri]
MSAAQTVINQGTKSSDYTYDKLNRLATVSRTDRSIASYVYDLRGNRLTFNSTEIPVYNEEMNYTYDLFNTLTRVSKGGATTSFDYCPDGMRYKKSTGTSTTQYRYNQNGEVIADANGSNQTTATYVRGDRLLMKKDAAIGNDSQFI